MEELKPCPFCGGEAVLYECTDYPEAIGKRWSVICNHCDSQISNIYQEKWKAINAWNNRAERTCHREEDQNNWGTMYDDWCSECNEHIKQGSNYCPGCGAKVVDGDE